MISNFPTYPTLVFDGHTFSPQVAVQRTQFEDGAVRQHMYTSRNLVRRRVRYTLCNSDDFHSFRDWVRDELKRGALWFMWPCPVKQRDGSTQPIRARIVEGKVEYAPLEASLNMWTMDFEIEHWDTAL